ncbi:MAG: 5-formyltetrahydrofolate cyclo-ligase [Pseudomonadota bacterium]
MAALTPDDRDLRRQLRRDLRSARRGLNPAEHRRRSNSIAGHAARTLLFWRARRFSLFLSADGEVDTTALMQRLWRRHAEVWLPCLGEPTLRFRRYRPGMRLRRGAFGIREPAVGKVRRARQLDVLLMPLVAFDPCGNRLGMGGGFYDRSLAFLRHRSRYRRPKLIGVAFDLQRIDALGSAWWDIKLDGVLTESGLHRSVNRHTGKRA